MPRHIEQPAKRHSAPNSSMIVCRPSASASSRTRADPGTTITRTPSAFLRPLMIDANARRSSTRLFVHEPMKTASTLISLSGMPGVRSMYSSARSADARSCGSMIVVGSGTVPARVVPWPGFVPQVTNGSSSSASRNTSASKTASSSVGSVFQYATAASQSSPVGAWSRPCT